MKLGKFVIFTTLFQFIIEIKLISKIEGGPKTIDYSLVLRNCSYPIPFKLNQQSFSKSANLTRIQWRVNDKPRIYYHHVVPPWIHDPTKSTPPKFVWKNVRLLIKRNNLFAFDFRTVRKYTINCNSILNSQQFIFTTHCSYIDLLHPSLFPIATP